MERASNFRLGSRYMIGATVLFAAQDGFSRHLAESYNVWMVVMLRYWFFAAFVTVLAQRQGAIRTRFPVLQLARGALLVGEICSMVLSYTLIGLVESYAVFSSYPLFVAALAPVFLREKGDALSWSATAVGFVGVLIVLAPGTGMFSWLSLLALAGAVMNAGYVLATRYVSARDSAMTSFFWTGVGGAMMVTPVGLWHWQPMTSADWGMMLGLCVTGAVSHGFLIKAFDLAEPASVQPLAYTQLVWIYALGVYLFGETIELHVALGVVVVVLAGVLTLARGRRQKAVVPTSTSN